MTSVGRFAGKVALITGASRGMGAEHARGVVAEGGAVAIADVLRAEGEALAEALGSRAIFTKLDITDGDQWKKSLGEVESRLGPVHILVNNAAVLSSAAIDTESPEQFRRVIEVNLTGAFLGMRTLAPGMRARKCGSIINISSAAGLLGYANSVAYVAAKWGLRGLSKAAALDLANSGVRVNTVFPGPTETPMVAGFDADARRSFCRAQPMSRWAQSNEVTRMVLFLASDESSYCTGGDYAVDGGASLGGGSRVQVIGE